MSFKYKKTPYLKDITSKIIDDNKTIIVNKGSSLGKSTQNIKL